MKNVLFLTLVILMAAITSSCHSSRKTLRGDEARIVGQTEGFSVRENRELHEILEPKVAEPELEINKLPKDEKRMRKAIVEEAEKWLGTRYARAGQSRRGVDCSGLVCQVFTIVANYKLPRSSREQAEHCKKIDRDKLRPGDLVFFKTSGKRISHVGIYVGDGKMIHASSSRGVITSRLDEDYWSRKYECCGRVESLFSD